MLATVQLGPKLLLPRKASVWLSACRLTQDKQIQLYILTFQSGSVNHGQNALPISAKEPQNVPVEHAKKCAMECLCNHDLCIRVTETETSDFALSSVLQWLFCYLITILPLRFNIMAVVQFLIKQCAKMRVVSCVTLQ